MATSIKYDPMIQLSGHQQRNVEHNIVNDLRTYISCFEFHNKIRFDKDDLYNS